MEKVLDLLDAKAHPFRDTDDSQVLQDSGVITTLSRYPWGLREQTNLFVIAHCGGPQAGSASYLTNRHVFHGSSLPSRFFQVVADRERESSSGGEELAHRGRRCSRPREFRDPERLERQPQRALVLIECRRLVATHPRWRAGNRARRCTDWARCSSSRGACHSPGRSRTG